MTPSITLAIDFGAKYIGLALVSHTATEPNQVLYATTVVVESKPLKALVEPRAATRRLRRTRKTHRRRLFRLAQSLAGIPGSEQILKFCRRRGFSYDTDETDDQSFHISREAFFQALEREVERVIAVEHREAVVAACAHHLNRDRRKTAELRPARFENRGRSRCNWEGCNHNVPRAEHDIFGRLQQSLFLWLQPVFSVCATPERLRKSVEHWIAELAASSVALRRISAQKLAKDAAKAARQPIDARVKRVYRNLRERISREASPEIAEQFLTNWTDYYQPIISEAVRGEATGRVRFCRDHSNHFVEHVLAGKPIPVKQELHSRDLIARTQQILFDRLARLIEARILPLTNGKIDEIVVERVAFDILSGPLKVRQNMSEQEASEIYWHGPQAGFSSRHEMFAAEFEGRCAYCGQQGALVEVEHILHRGEFPFDSYFNVLPACNSCNARKSGRTALAAQFVVQDAAYEAYCKYLASRKVLHPYHAIKKGMLNLLRRPATVERGQEMIGMIAENLLTITNTQRSPRPLARFLATRVAQATGTRPKVTHRAARHTALYRGVALPEYDKPAEKEAGDLRNHAVDAIMLGCDFPSASAFENQKWTRTAEQVDNWLAKVRTAAPVIAGGLPFVDSPKFVDYFEEDLGGGYCKIDLSAFNWNRRRKAAHKLDPLGKTQSGIPTKRIPAAAVLQQLQGGSNARDKQILALAHRGLRRTLELQRENAAFEFIRWLQKSVRVSLAKLEASGHPADQARRQVLASFVDADVEAILSPENDADIPWIIGVKAMDAAAPRQVNVVRSLPNNHAGQHYHSVAVFKAIIVGYREGQDGIDRDRPVLFGIGQTDGVSRRVGGKWTDLDIPDDSPLHGRSLGSKEPLLAFRKRWQAALSELVASEQIAKSHRVSQGCVVEKMDGSRFQLRNFKAGEPWMTASTFKNIRRVIRSPLAAIRRSEG